MEILKNRELIQRKTQLLRQLNNHLISQAEYDSQMPDLEKQIRDNTIEAIKSSELQMREEVQEAKNSALFDGDFKRSIAQIIINNLGDKLSKDELKGVFRQGYKIMRQK